MFLPWRVDPAGSIKLALELFPDLKNVLVITGAKDGVLPFLEEAKKAFIPWGNKLNFEYTNEMTYEDMIQRVSSLTNESIILYSTFFTDKLNRSFIPAEVVTEVCKKSKVPVFATLNYYMGLGIVGGALLETESLGKQAGSIALDYLNGHLELTEHVTSFNTPIHTMLDWNELMRFESSITSIPKDCIIVGKPVTLWEGHKQLVITIASFILFLSALIISLVFWNRRIQKMKNAAKVSEARYKLLIENTPEAVIVFDIESNKIVDANSKAEQLFACSRQELLQGGLQRFYHDSQPDGLSINESMALYNSMVLQGKEAIFEQYICNKDGHDLICEVRLTQLPNLNKQLIRGSYINITERKKAEDKLKESELKFKQLIKNSHDMIVLLDSNGNQHYVSESCERILGYKPEELINISVIEQMVHPEDQAHVIAGLTDILKNSNNGGAQYRHRHKNGSWVFLEAFGSNLLHNPLINSVVLNVRDITKQKQAEKILWENHQKLEAIISSSPDGIGITSLDGKLELISDKLLAIYGYTIKERDELIGKSFYDFVDSSNHNSMYENIQGLLISKPKDTISVYLAIKKDNTRIYVEVNSAILYDSEGNPEKILFVERDISMGVKNELIIINKNKELKELNATKDKFFSIIAHDLKSPFNSIVGFSNLLAEQMREKNYDDVEKFAGIIEKSSYRAMDLLMNLMEWSLSQTGRMEFNPEYFEMISLIKEVILLFDDIAGQKKISVNTNKLPANSLVFADKAMINTILRNLISNAIKFTHPGGMITISVEEKESKLIVSVSDNGVGISKEDCGKIFRIDESYSSSGTENENGTGLGLILCKEFVQKHGGKIWVESEVGKGSTFYFSLPNENASTEKINHKNIVSDTKEIQINNLKILIADDDETSQQLISIMVQKFGKELLHAQTGIETVEACRQNPDIDLILIDMKMPEMGGLEAIRQIRTFNKDVVIIAQTAYSLFNDREKAIEAGCNDYITKPIKRVDLIKLLKKYFKDL